MIAGGKPGGMKPVTDCVLDASAVLALLQNEPGGMSIAVLLPRAAISAVNLSEVIAKLIDHGATPEAAEAVIGQLSFEVVPATPEAGRRAGRLHARTRGRGVSLGDRFCLTLAMELGSPVFTADQAWAGLDLDLDIRLIR